jgi:hypothetical protein
VLMYACKDCRARLHADCIHLLYNKANKSEMCAAAGSRI